MMNVGSAYPVYPQYTAINPNPLMSAPQGNNTVAIRDYCVGRSGLPSFAIIDGKAYPADGLKIVEAHDETVGKIINPQTGQVLSERALISGWKECLNIERQ